MDDVPGVCGRLLVDDNGWFSGLWWVGRLHRITVRRMAMRRIVVVWPVVRVAVGSRGAVLVVSRVDRFRLVDGRVLGWIVSCAARWNLIVLGQCWRR